MNGLSSPANDNAAWGELKEGLHIAGYSFERACSKLETLLEDNRWKVGGRFEDINAFLDSLRFENLKASAEARKRIAVRIKALQPEASNRQIATTLGVSRETVRRDLGTNVPPQQGNPSKDKGAQSQGGTNVPPPPTLGGAEAAQAVERAAQSNARAIELGKRGRPKKGAGKTCRRQD
jgi:hypothetical protein